MLTDGAPVSIPANSTVNAFTGHPSEFLGIPTVMRLFITADAPGVTAQMLVNVGANQLAPLAAGSSVNTASIAGAGPKEDEDVVIDAVGIPAGGRSQLNLTNTTGAAIVARWRTKLQ